ncbi:hypothetical protein [Chryseobacterium sp. CFBP8996]|uniref:hypothetical protein n=1 Tax=Chryseobacterium sp. CFBP8996 TaxID=3096529 RepID=UPI002A6B3B17|nr:hypothetical protein [Chryseobacterium sp. CFBP8996]MDY0932385.1 hypothetical protein [Chryseobacterium sp. CFBP8996]
MIKASKEIKLYAYLGFLLSVLAYVLIQLYIKSKLPQISWTASDWLINYEDGGFKRRGLSGSFSVFYSRPISYFATNAGFLHSGNFPWAYFLFFDPNNFSKKDQLGYFTINLFTTLSFIFTRQCF